MSFIVRWRGRAVQVRIAGTTYGPQCPAPKQLVERTLLLIAYATDNRTMAEALGTHTRLLHQQLRSTLGVK